MLAGIAAGGACAAVAGLIVGVPSLRLKGLKLAITTNAFAVIINHLILNGGALTGGSEGLSAPQPALFGRAFVAIREHDIAAKAMGVDLVRWKLLAFMVSAFYTGIAGGLLAYYTRYLNVDGFSLLISIEALSMLIVGGLGSVAGALLGTFFIVMLNVGHTGNRGLELRKHDSERQRQALVADDRIAKHIVAPMIDPQLPKERRAQMRNAIDRRRRFPIDPGTAVAGKPERRDPFVPGIDPVAAAEGHVVDRRAAAFDAENPDHAAGLVRRGNRFHLDRQILQSIHGLLLARNRQTAQAPVEAGARVGRGR